MAEGHRQGPSPHEDHEAQPEATIAGAEAHTTLTTTSPRGHHGPSAACRPFCEPRTPSRLVAEVLVIGFEGPDGQELPQDPVGLATADLSLLGEEHEVQFSFPVKLEAPKDAEPLVEGLVVAAALDQGPTLREEIPDPHEVPVLIQREVPVPVLLQEPDGPELHLARSPRSGAA